ncbi:MAG: hypothetical protein ACI4JY_03435 [Oscillospiraceae bacterium]
MFCVGAKIAFSDGRQAAAKSAEDMAKIFEMDVTVTGMVCHADSHTLLIQASEDGFLVGYRNLDLKEALATKVSSLDAAKTIALHFMETGERPSDLNWQKIEWVDRV